MTLEELAPVYEWLIQPRATAAEVGARRSIQKLGLSITHASNPVSRDCQPILT